MAKLGKSRRCHEKGRIFRKKRHFSREHLVQQRPEGEDVRTVVHGLAAAGLTAKDDNTVGETIAGSTGSVSDDSPMQTRAPRNTFQ